MKKTLALIVTMAVLAGCSGSKTPTPSPVPSIYVSPSVTVSEASKPRPTPRATTTRSIPEESPRTNPQPTSTSTEAVPPATQFAQRWGKKYPNVPEYKILRAANRVCSAIQLDENWETNSVITNSISEELAEAGIDSKDNVEFAQDAEQNYCAGKV